MTTPPTQTSEPPLAAAPSNEEINARVLARIEKMSDAQVFERFVQSGVLRQDGSLTPEYGGPPSTR